MTDTALGSAEDLLGMTAREYRIIQAGGKSWRIQSLTEGERATFETPFNMEEDDPLTYQKARPRLIALCLVDKSGNRILSESQVAELFKVNASVTTTIYAACKALNNFGDQIDPKDSSETNADAS